MERLPTLINVCVKLLPSSLHKNNGQSKHIISNINSNLLRALSFHRPKPNPNRFSLSLSLSSISMATTSRNDEAKQNIFNELQTITDEFDHPFTPNQIETIAKFICVDYDDRRLNIQGDIVSKYFDKTPQFLAFGYLNQILEKLSQHTPLDMVEKHVEIFSFLIQKLKGYFDGADWLDKLESLVSENETYVTELVETEKQLKKIFKEPLREEREQLLGELQVRKVQLDCSEENISDQAFAEHLQNSEMIEGVFEKEIKKVQATIEEIMSDVKSALTFKAKSKLLSLEFDIFSPTIIREKGTRYNLNLCLFIFWHSCQQALYEFTLNIVSLLMIHDDNDN